MRETCPDCGCLINLPQDACDCMCHKKFRYYEEDIL